MKKIINIALFSFSVLAFAQEEEVSNEVDFNRWSIEINAGQNKAVRPFSPGYYSSDPTKYFNFSGVDHFDIGVRRMLSSKFGFKLDFAYDLIQRQDNSGSFPFETKQYRIGLQGVANVGRIMNFETFTNRFGLLLHAGLQVSQLTPQMNRFADVTEDNGGIIVGLTPQFRITDKIVLTGDFTALSNVRQHFNWDGQNLATNDNLSGLMYHTSLGLTVYLGKKEKHADWYIDVIKVEPKPDLEMQKRMDDLEDKLQDTDRDGIPDYIDADNRTPAGVLVDGKGRHFDVNKNGIPDELEAKGRDGVDGTSTNTVEMQDALKLLVEKGYVNVFFYVNEDDPNTGSTNNVYQIINFLRSYPDAKAKLVGYADVRGKEATNKDLSERRAQKVYNILVASGISKDRVSIAGNGVDTSYPTNTKIGLDLARRVSVIIE